MSKPRDNRHKDLFRPALDEIIDLGHPLARLTYQLLAALHVGWTVKVEVVFPESVKI